MDEAVNLAFSLTSELLEMCFDARRAVRHMVSNLLLGRLKRPPRHEMLPPRSGKGAAA